MHMKSPAFANASNQRWKDHATVPVDHGEDHIQMNRGPGLGDFHHDEILHTPLFSNRVHQGVDTACSRALAVSDHDQVFSQHQQVAPLYGYFLTRAGRAVEVETIRTNPVVVLEHGLEQQGFREPGLECHRTNDHSFIHRHDGIPREKRVREEFFQAVFTHRCALEQLCSQRGIVCIPELLRQFFATVKFHQFVHQQSFHVFIGQGIAQQILELIDISDATQYTGQLIMLPQCQLQVEDVVIQNLGRVGGRHVFDFPAGAVNHHGIERADLRVDIDLGFSHAASLSGLFQLGDTVQQFQRQRRAGQVDAQVPLQVDRGAHSPHAADVELPGVRFLRFDGLVLWIQDAFLDIGDHFLDMQRAVPAEFVHGDQCFSLDQLASQGMVFRHDLYLHSGAWIE